MLVEIEVKRPVAIPGEGKTRTIELRPGVNKIDDALFKHWFVKGLFESGAINVLKRKVNNFKSLDQIAEEKKQKELAEKKPASVEKEPVIFASHPTLPPVGTVLDKEAKKEEEVVVVKSPKVAEAKPKMVRRKKV